MSEVFRALACCVPALGLLLPAAVVAQESPPAGNAPQANAPTLSDGTEPGLLAALVNQLSAENRSRFGEMLAADWNDRPEWGDMLIALLKGEDLRPPLGWYRPSELKFGFDWLSASLDANADGIIDKTELPPDTPDLDRVYSRLDRDLDGKLQRLDFDYAGSRPATVPQTASQFLFSVLDTDSNGRLTTAEVNAFISDADREKSGFLTAEDLLLEFTEESAARNNLGNDMPGPDEMLAMFFRGELGLWEPGPKLGDQAPDFTLPTHDGGRTVTLSECRGKPVILIFGSFT
jgi:hypothetical protein